MRILVAENDVPLADFLCQKLQAEQFAVELIPGTREAEHLVAERTCDLALLDLALPYAAGIEALRHIRSKKPGLPVVFVTSLESVDERARCLDAGRTSSARLRRNLTKKKSAPDFPGGFPVPKDVMRLSGLLHPVRIGH